MVTIATDDLRKLKETEGNVKKNRERAIKEMEAELKKGSKSLNSIKSEVSQCNDRKDKLSEEIESLKSELKALQVQKKSTEAAVVKLNKEVEVMTGKV